MPARIVHTMTRKCGLRKAGGVYIVTEPSKDGALACFNLINPPIPYTAKPHRFPRTVNHWMVLARAPQDEWWFGASKQTEIKKAGDEWAFDTFGMTVAKRLAGGECAGTRDADEALAVLVNRVSYNNATTNVFKAITKDGIQEIPRVTVYYHQLHQALMDYANNKVVAHLMEAQAAVWRMAYMVPPKKRDVYIGNLARILVLLGLVKDAAYMLQTFGARM